MPEWSNNIPHDLAQALAELDGHKFTTRDSDRWGAIREWLIKHGVQAPERLPVRPEVTNWD